MTVNKTYFTDLFKDRKMSQREVARRIGVWAGGLSLTMDSKRLMKMDEAVRLARVLNVPLAEVMANAGIREAQEDIRYADILGHVTEGYVVIPVSPDTIERVPVPEGVADNVVAVQYRTYETPISHADGWMTFLGEQQDASELLGIYSLVAVEGEGWLMGAIRRGYAPGTYNIFTPNAQAPKTGRIMWARRALVTMH